MNPKHMRVKLPRNISDEELETMPEDFNRPLSEYAVAQNHALRHLRHLLTDSLQKDRRSWHTTFKGFASAQ